MSVGRKTDITAWFWENLRVTQCTDYFFLQNIINHLLVIVTPDDLGTVEPFGMTPYVLMTGNKLTPIDLDRAGCI